MSEKQKYPRQNNINMLIIQMNEPYLRQICIIDIWTYIKYFININKKHQNTTKYSMLKLSSINLFNKFLFLNFPLIYTHEYTHIQKFF